MSNPFMANASQRSQTDTHILLCSMMMGLMSACSLLYPQCLRPFLGIRLTNVLVSHNNISNTVGVEPRLNGNEDEFRTLLGVAGSESEVKSIIGSGERRSVQIGAAQAHL